MVIDFPRFVMLLAIFVAGLQESDAVTFEAEDILVAPVLATAPSDSNNQYENFSGWSDDSGSSLIVHMDETVVAADVPFLQFTGLTAGTTYRVQPTIAFSPQNISGGTFSWDYSFTSAVEAVGSSPLVFGNTDLIAGSVGSSAGALLTYDLALTTADSSGSISLYLGNKSQNVSSNAFSGIDQFEVVAFVEPPNINGVVNGSFEEPIIADGTFNPAGATGWTAELNGAVVNPNDSQFSGSTGDVTPLSGTADGFQFSGTGFGSGTSGGAGRLYQGLFANVEQDTTYTLTVAAGARLDQGVPTSGTMQLRAGSDTGTLLASLDVISGGVGGGAYDVVAPPFPSDTFVDYSFSVDTTDFADEVGNQLFIVFESPAGGQVAWDNVRLRVSIIPEPSSMMMAITSLLGLAIYRRR